VKTFARKNSNNLIELVDIKTGEVVKIQSTYQDVPDTNCTEVDTGKGLVLVEKGLSLNNVPRNRFVPYSPILIDIICQRIAEGETLTQICKDDDMPGYSTLSRWRREHSEVGELIGHARIDRAEGRYTRALQEADSADEDNVQANKLRFTAYQWAASVDNPEMYSPRTKVSGDKNAPVVIEIDTGIRNASDYHKDESIQTKDVTPGPEQLEESSRDSDGISGGT